MSDDRTIETRLQDDDVQTFPVAVPERIKRQPVSGFGTTQVGGEGNEQQLLLTRR